MLVRAVMASEKNDLRKLERVCEILDWLEQDVHEVYPTEAPPLKDGFLGTFRRLIVENL